MRTPKMHQMMQPRNVTDPFCRRMRYQTRKTVTQINAQTQLAITVTRSGGSWHPMESRPVAMHSQMAAISSPLKKMPHATMRRILFNTCW